ILRSANSRMKATFDHLDPEYRERIYGGVEGDSSAAGKTETKSIPTTLRTVQERGRQTAPTKSRSEFITRQEIETQINTKNSYLRQVNRYRVEIHKKFSIPFACIIFVLVGSPIAIRTGKSGMNTAIGLSILFFLVYYICLIGGEKLADRGFVNPIVAMWSPNAVFFVMAFLLLRAAARERSITEWRFAALLKPFRRNAVANSR
ncbi:MAG: LptF/LptG family permease, partial [Candidatus Krumholzibacteria bacterium]|nr:LptF/LptG family permease [Candidatus Krumholzibacteria bacterium]